MKCLIDLELALEMLDLDNEDIVIYEIGGRVGDIDSLPFLDAIRQIRKDKSISSALQKQSTDFLYIFHMSLCSIGNITKRFSSSVSRGS